MGVRIIVVLILLLWGHVYQVHAQSDSYLTETDNYYRAWARQTGTHPTPWYFKNRAHLMVNGSTRILNKRGVEDDIWKFAKRVNTLIVTRHTKVMKAQGPAWPSAYPKDRHLQKILKDQPERIVTMVERARSQNQVLFAYYFISIDKDIEKAHPEWVCKNPKGKPIPYKPNKGFDASWLDITGPYREVVLARLLEQAQKGVKGFMFDEIHMPFEGAWGTSTQVAWEALGNKTPKGMNLESQNYRDYVRFMYERVWDTFEYWQTEVQKQYPDTIFMVSVTSMPKLVSDRMPTSVGKRVDTFKNEYDLTLRANRFSFKSEPKLFAEIKAPDDIRMGFAWALLRDTAQGAPPRIWAPVNTFKQDGLLGFGSVMLYGNIANLGTVGTQMKNKEHFNEEKVSYYRSGFELGGKVGQWYEGRSLPFAAVYFSERLRHRYEGNLEKIYKHVIAPALGWYWAGTRLGLSMGVVADWQLSQLSPLRTPVLLVPDEKYWDDEMKEALNTYRVKGGTVIPMSNEWDWTSQTFKKTPAALEAAMAKIQSEVSKRKMPWSVGFMDPEKMKAHKAVHVVIHPRKNGNWIIAVTHVKSARHSGKQNDHVQSPREQNRKAKIEVQHIGGLDLDLVIRRDAVSISRVKPLWPSSNGASNRIKINKVGHISIQSDVPMAVFEVEWTK